MSIQKTIPCFGIIPSRYGSTRLPGKALADICGKPMFWHVYQRATACPNLDAVWIATDDQRIVDAARQFNIPYILTRPSHPSGSDRVCEAVHLLNLPQESVIINIQGDEPMLEPEMLTALLSPFFTEESQDIEAVTLARVLDRTQPEQAALAASPNQVKVVCDHKGNALYFSRSPIPFIRDEQAFAPCLGHVGLYAYRRQALERVTALPQSPLEQTEQLEQLRLLENGMTMRVVITPHQSHGVDTPEDLETVRSRMGHYS